MSELPHIRVGVIGGSGIYRVDGLCDAREVAVSTPFGEPSDTFLTGVLDGVPVAFLPRHGRHHHLSPSRINYRANIHGFQQLGVEYLIAASATGSLQERYKVMDLVVPDQIFDRTRGRKDSFFDDPDVGTDGLVMHVSPAEPFAEELRRILIETARAEAASIHDGGTLVVIEGPRYSTRAESLFFRSQGFALVGMTAYPECFLAREAGMSYAMLARVSDFDCWHEEDEPVTSDMVVARMKHLEDLTQRIILNTVRTLRNPPPSPYRDVLNASCATPHDAIPAPAMDILNTFKRHP